MKLKCMIVADPTRSAAELTASQCDRLADSRLIAGTSSELLELTQNHRPDLVVMSLELAGLEAADLVPRLQRAADGLFIITTYRELSVPRMEELARLGLEDFVPHPADALQIFRAASRRFRVPFRRHDRYKVTVDVIRADGVTVGRTIDLSEGGLCIEAIQPPTPGESILIDLPLGDEPKALRVRCNVLDVEGQAPALVTAHMQFIRLWGPEYRRLVKFLKRQPKSSEA
jgi:ActR/RegA family two-component response regulator